jgi:hypothetical protein
MTWCSCFNGLPGALRIRSHYTQPCNVLYKCLCRTGTFGCHIYHHLCGLVLVRAPGYRSKGPRFDSRRYHIFLKVVGPEQGPLSLVRITKELLGRKCSGSGLENRV